VVFEWIEGRYNPHRRHSSLGRYHRSNSKGGTWNTTPHKRKDENCP
jgi:hypothetical protein